MKRTLSKIEKMEFGYILSLISASVNNYKTPLPYKDICWDNIKKISQWLSVQSLVSNAILRLPKEYLPDSDFIKSFNESKNISLFIDSILDYEIENLLKTFDKYKIKNVPIKGYFLKKEYPQSDFRTLSDFDILFCREQIDDVKKAFAELGYDFLKSDDNQYHFEKKPYVYIEMHATLVHEYESYYPYLVDQIDRTTKRDGYDYSYEMSYEDHYIYLLVHSSNHFRIAGMSVRMMLDTYIFYRNHQADFDMDYLNSRLKLFKLDAFEKRVRQIAFNWFANPEPLISFDDFETYIFRSARLGSTSASVLISSQKMQNNAQKNGKKKTKFSYFMKSVFPTKNDMLFNYTYLKKYPFLLPVSWISMWYKRFFIQKNVNVKKGFQNRLSYTQEDVDFLKGVFEEVGFEDLN